MGDSENGLRQALIANVKEIKEEYDYPNLGVAFQHWVAFKLLGIEHVEVNKSIKGTMSRDKGIDYFYINPVTKTVEIMQTKFHEKQDYSASREDLSSFFGTVDRLKSKQGSESFKDHQYEYKEAVNRGFETKLTFVMMGSLTRENRDEINVCREKTPDIVFDCLETKDLLALVGKRYSRPCTLKLCGNEVFMSDGADGKIRKMAATIRAEELKKIYEEIGAYTLFYENPRYYMGPKKVSKGIKQTLQESPERLWHYNNGISAVCKRFCYNKEANTLMVEDLKVVNGCQTITTIAHCGPPINIDATLLFRLSEVDDDEFRNKISQNTNNQNRTAAADLNADKEELKLLEYKFREYPKFFLERKKGQFSIQKNENNKNAIVINSVDAAKLRLAYEFEAPHQSTRLHQENFFIEPTYSKIYKNVEPLDFILPKIFFDYLDEIKKDINSNRLELDLLSIDIGKYYVVAMVGKILRASQPIDRKKIIERIVGAVTDQNKTEIKELKIKLMGLTESIAKCLKLVLKNYKGELKNILEKEEEIFSSLYDTREALIKTSNAGQPDPFETELKKL